MRRYNVPLVFISLMLGACLSPFVLLRSGAQSGGSSSSPYAEFLRGRASDPRCVRVGQIYYRSSTGKIRSCSVVGNPGTWADVGNTGDTVGPASSTDNAIARFDSTTGKLLQNSTVLVGDTGNVTGLGTLNTHTLPGGTDTFSMLAASQTLTNKTVSLASNTITGTLAQFNTAVSDADLARTDAANTFAGTQSFSGQVVGSANAAASTPPMTLTGTWFTGGSTSTTKPTFLIEPTGATSSGWSATGTGFGVNAPSGFAGYLMDLQLNGSSRLTMTASGSLVSSSTVQGTDAVLTGSTGYLRVSTRLNLSAPSDGVALLQNAAVNDFGRLQFGGTSSSFPALKRSSANLEARLADDSGYTGHVASKFCYSGTTVCDFAGSGSPESAITASVGSTYRRTDGGAGTSFYVKESGSGNTGWVAK